MTTFNKISQAIVDSDPGQAISLVETAMGNDTPAVDILNKGLLAGMEIVGEKMESEEMFIPEVLMSANAMSQCVDVLKPHLSEEDTGQTKKVVIGTVQGDLHDIGKNLVSMLMESAGMEIYDLGVDVPPDAFVEKISEIKPEIVGISALLTTTMPAMQQTVEAISEAGLREQVKIMVGGAPVTQGFCDEIGADVFAPDANAAAKMAKAL
ncbi:MAG TPA: cobalamin-binding protein [Desulfobacteraceae bacterium]|nr:cobalamin-binding protein [Desulfobacteraceae bacterium]